MGNNPSSEGGGTKSGPPLRNFLKPTYALGLSKAELDARCKPSGLYPSCQWEDKAIRRLIGDGKIAARLKGTEQSVKPTDSECPICFFYYSAVNVTKCCHASICTECYLQVRPQKPPKTKDKNANGIPCPFCNSSKLNVIPLTEENIRKRMEEEQRLEAIQQKARERDGVNINGGVFEGATTEIPESSPEAASKNSTVGENQNGTFDTPAKSESSGAHQFGASLEQNSRIALLRARSSSISDSNNASTGGAGDSSFNNQNEPDITRMAMTPEERHQLEEEMRAQHHHPLTMRLEAEEAERRLRNERDYYLRQYANRNAGRHPGGNERDWNRIVDAFHSNSRNGTVQSLDDLVVLEAAIMLSMEEEAQRRGEPIPERYRQRYSHHGHGGRQHHMQAQSFDAARHAREGFPLARARAMRNEWLARQAAGGGRAAHSMVPLMMSEEEQIAMAIAASLQETNNNNDNHDVNNSNGYSNERGNNNNRDENAVAYQGDDESRNQRIGIGGSRSSGPPEPPSVRMEPPNPLYGRSRSPSPPLPAISPRNPRNNGDADADADAKENPSSVSQPLTTEFALRNRDSDLDAEEEKEAIEDDQ